jgi:hypothetical protein
MYKREALEESSARNSVYSVQLTLREYLSLSSESIWLSADKQFCPWLQRQRHMRQVRGQPENEPQSGRGRQLDMEVHVCRH